MRAADLRLTSIWVATLVPCLANASTHDGAYVYLLAGWLFAALMGILAAALPSRGKDQRARVFLVTAGLCILISFLSLLVFLNDGRSVLSLIGDAFLGTLLIIPIPFIIAFALVTLVIYVIET